MTARCLSISEAAAYCGVSVTTFRAEIACRIKPIAIGKRRVWDRLALDRWIGEQSGVTGEAEDGFAKWEKAHGV